MVNSTLCAGHNALDMWLKLVTYHYGCGMNETRFFFSLYRNGYSANHNVFSIIYWYWYILHSELGTCWSNDFVQCFVCNFISFLCININRKFSVALTILYLYNKSAVKRTTCTLLIVFILHFSFFTHAIRDKIVALQTCLTFFSLTSANEKPKTK